MPALSSLLLLLCAASTHSGPMPAGKTAGFIGTAEFERDMLGAFKTAVEEGGGDLAKCKNFPVAGMAEDRYSGLGDLCRVPKPELASKSVANEIKFGPLPLLCYSLLYSINSLCRPGTPDLAKMGVKVPQNVSQVNHTSPEKFCEEAGKITLDSECKDVVDQSNQEEYLGCKMVKLVTEKVLNSADKCNRECKFDTISPVCSYLVSSVSIINDAFVLAKKDSGSDAGKEESSAKKTAEAAQESSKDEKFDKETNSSRTDQQDKETKPKDSTVDKSANDTNANEKETSDTTISTVDDEQESENGEKDAKKKNTDDTEDDVSVNKGDTKDNKDDTKDNKDDTKDNKGDTKDNKDDTKDNKDDTKDNKGDTKDNKSTNSKKTEQAGKKKEGEGTTKKPKEEKAAQDRAGDSGKVTVKGSKEEDSYTEADEGDTNKNKDKKVTEKETGRTGSNEETEDGKEDEEYKEETTKSATKLDKTKDAENKVKSADAENESGEKSTKADLLTSTDEMGSGADDNTGDESVEETGVDTQMYGYGQDYWTQSLSYSSTIDSSFSAVDQYYTSVFSGSLGDEMNNAEKEKDKEEGKTKPGNTAGAPDDEIVPELVQETNQADPVKADSGAGQGSQDADEPKDTAAVSQKQSQPQDQANDSEDSNLFEKNQEENKEEKQKQTKFTSTMNRELPEEDRSNFLAYFILLSIVSIIAYSVFHNKQKILALILEGRRRQPSRRRSGGREYTKLDSNLEDTMTSRSDTSMRHVIY